MGLGGVAGTLPTRGGARQKRDRNLKGLAQLAGKTGNYLFFALFFVDFDALAGCVGCSLCSGSFAIVTI